MKQTLPALGLALWLGISTAQAGGLDTPIIEGPVVAPQTVQTDTTRSGGHDWIVLLLGLLTVVAATN